MESPKKYIRMLSWRRQREKKPSEWVYEKSDDGCYTKKFLSLGRSFFRMWTTNFDYHITTIYCFSLTWGVEDKTKTGVSVPFSINLFLLILFVTNGPLTWRSTLFPNIPSRLSDIYSSLENWTLNAKSNDPCESELKLFDDIH